MVIFNSYVKLPEGTRKVARIFPRWTSTSLAIAALQVQAAMRSKLKYESAAEAPWFFCQADDSPHSPITLW